MARPREQEDGHRLPQPRPPLPECPAGEKAGAAGAMTHAELVEALNGIDGLVDVTGGNHDRPNFHLRHKPFLHFHVDQSSGDIYADVKLGGRSEHGLPAGVGVDARRAQRVVAVGTHARASGRSPLTVGGVRWLHRRLAPGVVRDELEIEWRCG